MLARIDKTGHYERGNVRWVPKNTKRPDLTAERTVQGVMEQIVKIVARFNGRIPRRVLRCYCRCWSKEMFSEGLSKLTDLGFIWVVSDGWRVSVVSDEKIAKEILASYKEPKQHKPPKSGISLLPDKMPLTDQIVRTLRRFGGEMPLEKLRKHSSAPLWGKTDVYKAAIQELVDAGVVERRFVEKTLDWRTNGAGERIINKVRYPTKYIKLKEDPNNVMPVK